MLRNQKGFTYPVTLGIMILLSTLLVTQIEQFLIERKMLNATESILKQDYYLLSAVEQIQTQLMKDENAAKNGTFHFKEGEVRYQILERSEGVWEIAINIIIHDKDTLFKGTAVYDRNLRKIVKWTEIN
ncbi:competence type IV pilus minor pilin ComGG [Niallia sp. Krafla_26]|uniref:competence type IV pilus minor pilin ComGG n=1 Tax=Niallia sp. Krafla_26 TaxID=3064703 RepID=UPI003D168996